MVKWSRYLPSKHKMLAEDPSSILGGSKRHLEDSGTTFFAFLPFSIVHSLCCIAWENKRKISFKSEDPFGSSDRTPWPGRWQGRKRTAIVAILDVWNCTQNVVWLSAIYVHRWPLLSYSAHRYCECFASGLHCNSCNCSNCCNNLENTTVRQEAVESTLERNPNAFRPKIAPIPGAAEDADGAGRHNKVRISFQIALDSCLCLTFHKQILSSKIVWKMWTQGCHCKKSSCLKKYCECFQANIFCADICRYAALSFSEILRSDRSSVPFSRRFFSSQMCWLPKLWRICSACVDNRQGRTQRSADVHKKGKYKSQKNVSSW